MLKRLFTAFLTAVIAVSLCMTATATDRLENIYKTWGDFENEEYHYVVSTGKSSVSGTNAREFVDGENGFLVPIKNPTALAEKMVELIQNPALCEKMGTAGRRIAEEKFDVKKVNHSILSTMELL